MENMEEDAPGGLIDIPALGALTKEYLKRRREVEQQHENCNRLRTDIEFLNRLIMSLNKQQGGEAVPNSLQGAIASQLLEIEREANRKKRELLQAQQAALQQELSESLRRLTELREGFHWASTYERMQKSWEALKVNADFRNFFRSWTELKDVATAAARTAPRDSMGARDGGSAASQPVEPGRQQHRTFTATAGPAAARACASSRRAASPRAQPEGPEPQRPKRARKFRDVYTPPGDDVPQHLSERRKRASAAAVASKSIPSAPASPERAPKAVSAAAVSSKSVPSAPTSREGAPKAVSAAAVASKSLPSAPASPEGAPKAAHPGHRTRSSSPTVSRAGPPGKLGHMAEISSQDKTASLGKVKCDVAESNEKGVSIQ